MTNGFRIVFRRVFSEARQITHDPPIGVDWFGIWIHLASGLILLSDPARGATSPHQGADGHGAANSVDEGERCLGGLEPRTYVVVLAFESDLNPEELQARLDSGRAELSWSATAALAQLRVAIDSTPYAAFLDSLRYPKPDVEIYVSPDTPDGYPETLPFILGFYRFGQLTVHRIDRDQARFEIPSNPDKLGDRVVTGLAVLRARVTNVNRLFLTTNRSSSRVLRSYCLQLAKELELGARCARLSEVVGDLERHLDRVVSLGQLRNTRRVNLVLMLVGVFGLPAAWLSAVLAFGYSAAVVSRPLLLLRSERFVALFGGMWVLVVIALFTTYALASRSREGSKRP